MAVLRRLQSAFRSPSEVNRRQPNPNTANGNKTLHAEDGNGENFKPTPVGFWHRDLRQVRNRAFAKWTITTAFLMAFILAVLSIYWGVFYQVETRLKNLAVFVVDFDGVSPFDNTGNAAFVGPTITDLVKQAQNSGQPTIGWSIRDPAEFNNDPINLKQAVYDQKAWAAIYINPNASALLYDAINTGNTSYEPLGACGLVFMDSRDDTNWYDFIYPIISPFMTEAQSMVGQQWAKLALQQVSSAGGNLANIQAVPQALNPAIGFSQYNLRPFFPYTAIPSVSIGLIYLIIISFFSFSFYMPIHMQYMKPVNHPPLKFPQLILWRWLATISAYFFLSLAYSFVSMAFQINFFGYNPVRSETAVTEMAFGNPVAYGHGTFPVYWMINFFGMIALGLACENAAMVVGMPWMGLFLIFWVITNVSTSFYDIQIAPGFYHWGYAWPLHSIVEASRSTLFDLHSKIGLDFGILIAWGAVNSAFFPLCCWFARWKSQREVHEYWPMD